MSDPTKDQREAAALFYCKSLTGEQRDWVQYGLAPEMSGIDDDIVSLAQLLADREAPVGKLRRKLADAARAFRSVGVSILADDIDNLLKETP